MDTPTRQEFDELKYIVENHKHQQYDKTKPISDASRYIVIRSLDASTSHSTGTTVGGDFEFPFSGSISNVYAYCDTYGTTGTLTIDLNIGGSTILSTKITIDSTEKSSRTAATQPVLSTASFVTGDILTVDIDAVQTTPGRGLSIVIVT